MSDYDLIVRNAKIVTEDRQTEGDIGVKDGRIAAIEPGIKGKGDREIDAGGKFVLPGGIDSHVHVEQRSGFGIMCADDFYTGTVSAAFGGTTTIIPFAAQHRGMSLRKVVNDYHEAATPKAVIDYAFHLIVTDPTPQALGQDLPALIKDGYTSFKIYMTYDAMKVSDYQILDILALARKEGALVMVHAENHDMIQWLAHHLVEQGHGAPKFHAIAHARPLLDMDVTVDAARQDELATGVDLARGRALEPGLDGGDPAILDGNVAFGLAVLGDDVGVANDQVVVSHRPTPPQPYGRARKRRAGAPTAPSTPRARRDPSRSTTIPARAAWDS